ncbi:MAG: DUF4347 domain-containing protein [Chlorobiaceae bacterium]
MAPAASDILHKNQNNCTVMAKTMVFIDSRVSDYKSLIMQVDSGTKYQVLDANLDGIAQIASALYWQSGYDSVQIISHGSHGSMTIGNTNLDRASLSQYVTQLSGIGHALTGNGDLLLYGCNIGAGAEGHAFVDMLSLMTGADVAASNDPTGGIAAGGDWALEVQSGVIETTVPIANAALQQYGYTLTSFSDVEAKTTIEGFTDAQKASILADLQTAYEDSPIAKKMFDDWVATYGHTINISYASGQYRGFLNTGRVEIDPAFIENLSYINDKGEAVLHSQLGALVHELGHALTGKRDNISLLDYQGANVKYINTIWEQLGLDNEISYVAQAWEIGKPIPSVFGSDDVDLHKAIYTYTSGTAIDVARTGDINMNLYALGASNDLLIGGPSANLLQSGSGDDFLFGAGGNDRLYGGSGIDTSIYFGSPLDYDIRKNIDGTWSVGNVRGGEDSGLDTLVNIEAIQFDDDQGGHQTYRLQRSGLTFQTDFAIVVDTTGSMYDDIASVQGVAGDLVNAAFAGGTVDARIGVVTFKDLSIGEPTEVVLPFTEQTDFAERKTAAIAAINGLSVYGGGDLPETAFDGLRLALNGSMGQWRFGAGIMRVAMFTDAPAKDGDLAAEVTALAHSVGATIETHASLTGAGGSVDTFSLSFGDSTPVVSAGLFGDGDSLPPFEFTDEPVAPDDTTSQVQIFTIVTGSPYWDTMAFESIASENGGRFMIAEDNDALIKALFDIIEGVNNPPTDITLSNNMVSENASIGQVIATLSTTDADASETFTYLLLANPGNLFVIDGANLVVANTLDYETAVSHDITLRVADSATNTFDKMFTIDVTNVGGVLINGTSGGNLIDATHTLVGQSLPTNEEDTINGLSGNDSVSGLGGNDIINGDSGNDVINGGDGHDTINGGSGNDVLNGGAGNDSLNGGSGNDSISGLDGNDILTGDSGNDTLDGGSGNDTFDGGNGNDTLTGGTGSDTIQFSTALGISNVDVITDFQSGSDKIEFLASLFANIKGSDSVFNASDILIGAGVTKGTVGGNEHLIFNTANKALYYDADGGGAGAGVQFATLTGITTLSYTDFLVH